MGKFIDANNLLKAEIKERFNIGDWQYTDFVLEDRFFDELDQEMCDGLNTKSMDAQNLCDYALGKILS